MSVSNIFHVVKVFKKQDLKTVADELGLSIPVSIMILELKDLIINNTVTDDTEFVKEILATAVEERKQREEFEKDEREREKKCQLEKKRLDKELEQFGDDLKDWIPFWSQFQHIDKDEEIAPEDKFQYLIQATIVGSSAREVVESFPPTGSNYRKAVESLKSRFGKDDLLVESFKDYLRLYLDTGVVLLAEGFETFRTLRMNYFELDAVHFYTTPSLTWTAGIKTTNVTLELLTHIDMHLMFEWGIRGGM
ncbi:endonuclease [Caerostris darwini]|uniref:Endonuclease n=1 Tax=Caerostris darwini TaxID=1538125 RepID=A0AAV4NI71_9ARAC|nr:endonuclease [Caerostris darwini]